jgi:predicted house-cleaning noncanonical NTP pyrophosphatase (MazG superfamily)
MVGVICLEKPKSKKYDKLIRDKIPEIIEASGSKAVIEVLDNDSYHKYLNIKLAEEFKEYQESGSIEELADLVEVVYALLDCMGVTREQFDAIRSSKNIERGAFKKKFLLKEVIDYYEG